MEIRKTTVHVFRLPSGMEIHLRDSSAEDVEYLLGIERLHERLRVAEKDAARYRWLIGTLDAAYSGGFFEGEDGLTVDCMMVIGHKQYRRVQAVIGWGDTRDEPINLTACIDKEMEK